MCAIESVSVTRIDLRDESFRLSRMNNDESLSVSIRRFGILEQPVLVSVSGGFRIVSGHRRIGIAKDLGIDAVRAEIWNEFDLPSYAGIAARKIYHKSAGIIGRIRGFGVMRNHGMNDSDARKILQLPENLDQSAAVRILSLPSGLRDYMDEKDAPYRLVEKVASFDEVFIGFLDKVTARAFSFSVFREIAELYDDIRRSDELLAELFSDRVALDSLHSDSAVCTALRAVRNPTIGKWMADASSVKSSYAARKIELNFPSYGEGNSASISLVLKKSDGGKSFRESVRYLFETGYDDILKLL